MSEKKYSVYCTFSDSDCLIYRLVRFSDKSEMFGILSENDSILCVSRNPSFLFRLVNESFSVEQW